MTYLDERDDSIQYGIITVLALATIAVMCYLVFGGVAAAYCSLALYALGFIAISLFSIRKVFLVLNYKEKILNFEATTEEELDEEFFARKNNAMHTVKVIKTKELIKAICSGLFAIFTIVVLVLF